MQSTIITTVEVNCKIHKVFVNKYLNEDGAKNALNKWEENNNLPFLSEFNNIELISKDRSDVEDYLYLYNVISYIQLRHTVISSDRFLVLPYKSMISELLVDKLTDANQYYITAAVINSKEETLLQDAENVTQEAVDLCLANKNKLYSFDLTDSNKYDLSYISNVSTEAISVSELLKLILRKDYDKDGGYEYFGFINDSDKNLIIFAIK